MITIGPFLMFLAGAACPVCALLIFRRSLAADIRETERLNAAEADELPAEVAATPAPRRRREVAGGHALPEPALT